MQCSFLNLRKAFDTVACTTSRKNYSYGLHSSNFGFLACYFQNERQLTYPTIRKWSIINSDLVPNGQFLGPFVFAIFNYDVSNQQKIQVFYNADLTKTLNSALTHWII